MMLLLDVDGRNKGSCFGGVAHLVVSFWDGGGSVRSSGDRATGRGGSAVVGVLEDNVRVPEFVGKDVGHRARSVPVEDQETAKDGFQKGAREEKEIARDGNPHNALDLTFRRHLIDGPQQRIHQKHSLTGIKLQEKKDGIQDQDEDQTKDEPQEGGHGPGPTGARIEILFENVRPIDQNENKDAKEAQRSGTEQRFAQKGSHPRGILKRHDRLGRIRGRKRLTGNQKPHGPQGRRHENQTIKGRHHRRNAD
eukprot:scaffold49704_cov54-Attheya_sp.AAC.1